MAECSSITVVPGPPGSTGAAGANGTNGQNAYTVTTSSFTMPAESANVTVAVSSSAWATIGQVVAVAVSGAFGHFQVIAKPTSTTIQLQNLKVTASGTYPSNSPATTPFASGATVSPAGLQGPAGVAASAAPVGATFITQTPDGTLTNEQSLSGLATGILKSTTATGVISTASLGVDYYGPAGADVAISDGGTAASTAANARINLGLIIGVDIQAYNALLQVIAALAPTVADRLIYTTGVNTVSVATLTAAARTILDDATTADMRTTLGLVLGTNVQAFDATLLSLAALGTVADRYAYTTALDTWAEGIITATSRALLANSSIQTWNFALGGQIPRYGRLGSINGVNLNSTADTTLAVDAYVSNARYRIDKIMVENASISVTTATVGVFTAAGGGGTTIAADQVISGLTASTKWVALTLAAVVGTDVMTASPLYFRVGTPQGAAATANVHLFGWSFDGP